DVADKLTGTVKAIKPGESLDVAGITFQTTPAYSTVEHRLQTHPKSNNWVGYILGLNGHRYWFSGDGDPNPDIEKVKTDVALICAGGDPYVMNASEAAGVVKKIKPQLAVPNHYGFVVGGAADGETVARAARSGRARPKASLARSDDVLPWLSTDSRRPLTLSSDRLG